MRSSCTCTGWSASATPRSTSICHSATQSSLLPLIRTDGMAPRHGEGRGLVGGGARRRAPRSRLDTRSCCRAHRGRRSRRLYPDRPGPSEGDQPRPCGRVARAVRGQLRQPAHGAARNVPPPDHAPRTRADGGGMRCLAAFARLPSDDPGPGPPLRAPPCSRRSPTGPTCRPGRDPVGPARPSPRHAR